MNRMKKAIACLTSLLTAMCLSLSVGADALQSDDETAAYLIGDMNADAAVTVADLVLLARYISQDAAVTPSIYTGLQHADLSGDGIFDAADLLWLSNYLAGTAQTEEGQSDAEILAAAADLMPEYPAPLGEDKLHYIYGDTIDASLSQFSARTIPGMLTEKTRENIVYSPLSGYMALSALTETVEGDAQSELFSALGVENADALRAKNTDFFDTLYFSNDKSKCILANSVWLDDQYHYQSEPLQTLSDWYSCQVYRYDHDAREDAQELASRWLRLYTGGKIENTAVTFPEERVMTLINTIDFEDSWRDSLLTLGEREFTRADGSTAVAEYIGMEHWEDTAVVTDSYTKVSLPTANGFRMDFVLPAEGLTVQELLADSAAVEEILAQDTRNSSDAVECYLTLRAPKFSYGGKLDLISSVRSLGAEMIFTPSDSFAPLTTDVPLFVSEIRQEAHIAIDEIGCSAAAFTIIAVDAGTAPPEEKPEVTVDLNRPFFYCLCANDGTPLFVGTVNDPTAVS